MHRRARAHTPLSIPRFAPRADRRAHCQESGLKEADFVVVMVAKASPAGVAGRVGNSAEAAIGGYRSEKNI